MKYILLLLAVLFIIMAVLLISILHGPKRKEPAKRREADQDPFEDELNLPQDIRNDSASDPLFPADPQELKEQEETADHLLSNEEETEMMNGLLSHLYEEDPQSETPETQSFEQPSQMSETDSGTDDLQIDFSHLEELLHAVEKKPEEDMEEIEQTGEPQNKAEENLYDTIRRKKRQNTEEEDLNLNFDFGTAPANDAEILKKCISAAWPQSDVMMKPQVFGTSILYVFEGLVKKEETVLFEAMEHGICYPLLETARKIIDRNQKPAVRFAFLIHSGNEFDHNGRQMAVSALRNAGRSPVFMISEKGGMELQDETLRKYAPLTVGTRAYAQLSCDAPAAVMEKCAEAVRKQLKSNELNRTAEEAFRIMKKDLPHSARRTMTMKSALAIAEKYPESSDWAFPKIIVTGLLSGSEIEISAPDFDIFEEALGALRNLASENGYSLRIESRHKETSAVSTEDPSYQKVASALSQVLDHQPVIPVLSDEDYTMRGIRSFALNPQILERKKLYRFLDLIIGI